DGKPAVAERVVGKGKAVYCGFLPGLTYFQPALPQRPVDRTSAEDSLAHLVPTKFDEGARKLFAETAKGAKRVVVCSEPLVETTVLESKSGVVVPLINWSGGPVKGLRVTAQVPAAPTKVTRASGGPVTVEKQEGKTVYVLDLDVADAL